MPIFDTLDQITVYVNSVTALEVAEAIEDFGVEALNKTVWEEVYKDTDRFGDQPYEHTYGLKDKANGDLEIYSNKQTPKTVALFLKTDEKYPSFYTGNADNSENIVNWLDNGHKGYYLGQKIGYSGRNIFEKTARRLLKGGFLKDRVTNRLRFLGYDISRTPSMGGDE